MKRKDVNISDKTFLLSQVQLLLLWLWPVLRLCGGPPYKVIEYQIDVRISKGILVNWHHLTNSNILCQGVTEVATEQLRERTQPEGRWLALSVTCTVYTTPLSLLYLSHLTNDKKRTVSKKWSKQPKFLNPHQQDHQAHHPRWFEGRTHGERRRPRRTRTPMMPMTPLDNKPLGRFENVFFYNVCNYIGRMNKILCLSVQWA